jgi:hypothetical protein
MRFYRWATGSFVGVVEYTFYTLRAQGATTWRPIKKL